MENFLNGLIDKSKMEVVGELQDKIMEYCQEHSSNGTDSDFSAIPMDIVYRVCVDAINIAIEQIINKFSTKHEAI